jgi:coenzyme Q-binding protein COQ10
MATKTLPPLARFQIPLVRTSIRAKLSPLRLRPHHRTFLNDITAAFNPLSRTPQTFHTSKILPYPSLPIYDIISDVSSYRNFVPYCQSSTVTKWSHPDRHFNRKWPSEAKLVVGFGGITEEYTSRIYCVPGHVVEALAGDTQTTLKGEEVRHHEGVEGVASDMGPFTHLLTRWTVVPWESVSRDGTQKQQRTEVKLSIEFAFSNPIYTTLTAGAAPKVAERMIMAFEERVKAVLGNEYVANSTSWGAESRDESR